MFDFILCLEDSYIKESVTKNYLLISNWQEYQEILVVENK